MIRGSRADFGSTGTAGALVGAFERIFGATVFFGTEQLRSAARVVHRSRFNFMREAQIWYSRRPEQPVPSEEFENVIVLSDEFYREIRKHPIPADPGGVRLDTHPQPYK